MCVCVCVCVCERVAEVYFTCERNIPVSTAASAATVLAATTSTCHESRVNSITVFRHLCAPNVPAAATPLPRRPCMSVHVCAHAITTPELPHYGCYIALSLCIRSRKRHSCPAPLPASPMLLQRTRPLNDRRLLQLPHAPHPSRVLIKATASILPPQRRRTAGGVGGVEDTTTRYPPRPR